MDQRAPTSYKTHHDNIAENVKKFANGKFCKDEMQLKMKCKTVERKLISDAKCTFLIDAHSNSSFCAFKFYFLSRCSSISSTYICESVRQVNVL